jgi:hypothetical protein
MKRVLVLGATGVMGRRLVPLCRRMLPDTEVVQASRHPQHASDHRTVDMHDPESLRHGLAGIDVVINSVGPFDYDPRPLVTTCLAAGCHYIDIAETPDFIARVQEAARPPAAAARSVHALSGCSTLPGLVQVLAQHWTDRQEVKSLRILLGMGSKNTASAAMLYSLLKPLGMTAPDGTRYFARLVRKQLQGVPARLYGRYPSPFDDQGLRVGDRVLPAPFHAGMDRGALGYGLWLAARVVPYLSAGQLAALCRLVQPLVPLVQSLGTPVGILSVEARDGGGRLVEEIEVRAAREGLNVPALPAVWVARRLLAGALPPGPLRIEQLLTPGEVFDWLRAEGYAVVLRGPIAQSQHFLKS